jgi:hypothetical protein
MNRISYSCGMKEEDREVDLGNTSSKMDSNAVLIFLASE